MSVYLLISFGAIACSLIPLWSLINIHALSFAPIVFILMSVLQIFVFRSISKRDTDLLLDSTAYTTEEVDRDAYRIGMKYHALCKMAILPPLCALVFYGNGIFKIIVSVGLYLLSFFPVKFLVRWEQKKGK